MRTSKLLVGALVCLLGLGTVVSCAEKKPSAPTQEELNTLADKLIKRVTVESSLYQQAKDNFDLPSEMMDGETSYPITWTSSKEKNAKIEKEMREFTKDDGETKYQKEVTFCKITRPMAGSENIAFTLTATLKVGEVEKTKTFEGYVMAEEKAEVYESIGAIYADLEAKTLPIDTKAVNVKAYITYTVKDGYYLQTSESDRAMYVYDKKLEDFKAKGYKIGDQLEVTGPVAVYSSYQFKVSNCKIEKTDAAAKVMTLADSKKAYTVEELASLDTANYYHEIYGTKWTIEGTVKVVLKDPNDSKSHDAFYLATPEGSKWSIKFDYGTSNPSVYNTLKSKDGQTVKLDVFYYGHYQSEHKLGIIGEAKAA